MITLYEVIDKGTNSRNILAVGTPSMLTADEARAMVTQDIALRRRATINA